MQFTNGAEKPMEFNRIHLFSIVSVFPTLSAFKGFSQCGVTANISRIWANQARLKNIGTVFNSSMYTRQP